MDAVWKRRSVGPRGQMQRGYAILATVVIIALIFSTYLVTTFRSSSHNDQARTTTAALALAKEALIGRGGSDANRPGSLPCPDLDNDGQLQSAGELFGNCAANVGRLPWRTLGLPDLRDGNGDRLWYAVSPNFFDIAGLTINDATVGTLSVTGATPATNVAAIVFAAGTPLTAQSRDTAANQNTASNYLEGANAAGGTAFVTQLSSTTFNDQLLAITVPELMRVVRRRVASEITAALNTYFQANAQLPTPAAIADAGCQAGQPATSCTPSGSTAAAGRLPRYVTVGTWPALLGQVDTWFDLSWRTSVTYSVSADCATTPACVPTGFTAASSGTPKVTLVVGNGTTLTVPLVAR
jgi:hypothetical protein